MYTLFSTPNKKTVPARASAEAGFTLVELLVSLAIFTIVITAAIGSLYTVNEASAQVTAMGNVLNNLNFAVESMSRSIRTGSDIVCGGASHLSGDSNNCPFGTTNGSEEISFKTTIGGNQWYDYRWRTDNTTNNGEIQRCDINQNSDANQGQIMINTCVSITDPQINIQHAYFFVDGADISDGKQPSVMIMLQGVAKAGTNDISPFAVQTYVSQRAFEQ